MYTKGFKLLALKLRRKIDVLCRYRARKFSTLMLLQRSISGHRLHDKLCLYLFGVCFLGMPPASLLEAILPT